MIKGKIYRFTILIMSLLVFVLKSNAQPQTLSELEKQYENTSDNIEKLSLIHQIIQNSKDKNPELSLRYSENAEELLPKVNDVNLKVRAYQDIAIANYVNQDQEKAESYANESINLSQQENYKEGVVKGLNLLSNLYREKDKERAYNFARQAFFVAKDGKVNEAGVVEASNNIVAINKQDVELESYLKEARKYVDKVKNPETLMVFYRNAGAFEVEQKNYQQADLDYNKAVEHSVTLGDKKQIASNLNRLGKVNIDYLGKESQGLEYLFQAYVIAQEYKFEGNGNILYDVIQNIAIAYENLENKANNHKSKQYKLLKEDYQKRSNFLSNARYNIDDYLNQLYGKEITGRRNVSTNNVANEELLNELARQKRLINNLLEANNILEIASKKARLQHEEDSILILKKDKTIAQLRADLEDKTLENNSLRTAQKNHEREIKDTRNYWQLWLILAIILGALCITYFSYRNRRSQQEVEKQQVTLNNYKERINRQEKDIREGQDKIKIKQEQLASTNAKLDDAQQQNIAIQQVLVQELKEPLKKIITETQEEEKAINRVLVHQSGKQMLNLITSIEDVQKYENAKVQLFKESYPIYKTAKQAIKENETLIKEKGIEIENNIKPYLYANFDKEIILKVFHNYLANCLKYTGIGGKIMFDAQPVVQDKTYFIKIVITDNGKIVPQNLQSQTYEKFSVEEARPSSLGLVFNKLMIEEHEGKVGIASNQEKGTSFFFTLPESTEDVDFKEVFEHKKEKHLEIETNENLDVKNPIDKVILQLDIDSKKLLQPFLKKFSSLEYFEISSINAVLRDIHFDGNSYIQQWKKAMQNAIYYVDEENYKRLTQI